MAKTPKTPKLSSNQQEYLRNIERIRRAEASVKREGYLVEPKFLDVLPSRVTKTMLREMREYRTPQIRASSQRVGLDLTQKTVTTKPTDKTPEPRTYKQTYYKGRRISHDEGVKFELREDIRRMHPEFTDQMLDFAVQEAMRDPNRLNRYLVKEAAHIEDLIIDRLYDIINTYQDRQFTPVAKKLLQDAIRQFGRHNLAVRLNSAPEFAQENITAICFASKQEQIQDPIARFYELVYDKVMPKTEYDRLSDFIETETYGDETT